MILGIVGGIVLVAGIGFVFAGLDTRPFTDRGTATFNIPAGAEWIYVFELDMASGGRVAADFTVLSGGRVNAYVFDQASHDVYVNSPMAPPSLATASGAAGNLAAAIPSDGRYYLVFEHASGSEGLAQDVRVNYEFAMVRPAPGSWVVPLAIGGIALVIGAGLIAGAFRLKKRVEKKVPPAAISDVVMFEEEPPG